MFKGSVREKWKGVRFAINIVIIPISWKPEPTCIYIYILYCIIGQFNLYLYLTLKYSLLNIDSGYGRLEIPLLGRQDRD